MAKKLCKLYKKFSVKKNIDKYSEIVINSKFICSKCGRSSNSEKYLCKPIKLN